mmetsp:Transcript_2653/g.3745  ORF Transcript_2653/g.3745 Transcript_2653/m.3745 type:complete len:211 (-) Transcript_2653:532-1164(-)
MVLILLCDPDSKISLIAFSLSQFSGTKYSLKRGTGAFDSMILSYFESKNMVDEIVSASRSESHPIVSVRLILLILFTSSSSYTGLAKHKIELTFAFRFPRMREAIDAAAEDLCVLPSSSLCLKMLDLRFLHLTSVLLRLACCELGEEDEKVFLETRDLRLGFDCRAALSNALDRSSSKPYSSLDWRMLRFCSKPLTILSHSLPVWLSNVA